MTGWITGTGAISCVGANTQALWQSALEGRSGIDQRGLGPVTLATLERAVRETGASFKNAKPKLEALFEALVRSKPVLLAALAAVQALESAGWTGLGPDDGLILASTTGQIPVWDKSLIQYLRGEISVSAFRSDFQHQPLGTLLEAVCDVVGRPGLTSLVTSACSAGTQALALGAMWLRQGRVKRVLVGGSEILCDLTVEGFRSLQLLSPDPATPFDARRKGINLSEGAAFICMETERRPNTLAQVSGYGMSTDGFHMTSPHPEGRGCHVAMTGALKTAKLSPADIDWVHAHGTGSQHNDLAEGAAVRALFNEAKTPWVSSTKWLHGHALGASGVLETALCIEAIRHQTVVRTWGLEQPDPHIGVRHPTTNTSAPIRHILKNTLGFGGVNAALALSSPEANA